jgi:hypothetical protein
VSRGTNGGKAICQAMIDELLVFRKEGVLFDRMDMLDSGIE